MYRIVFLLCCFASIHSRPFHRLNKVPADDDMLLFWKTPGSKRCKPFDAFYDNCNRCVCGADGILYCTRIICSPNGIEYEYDTENPDTSTLYHKNKRRLHKKHFRKRRRHASELKENNFVG